MQRTFFTRTLTGAALAAVLSGPSPATVSSHGESGVSFVKAVFAAPPRTKATPQKVRWHTSLPSATQESRRSGKPIFAYFYASWCAPCQKLEKQTFPNPKVIADSRKWVMLKIDSDKQAELAEHYGVSSLPTMAVLETNGDAVTSTGGFLSAGELVQFLRGNESTMKQSLKARAQARTKDRR